MGRGVAQTDSEADSLPLHALAYIHTTWLNPNLTPSCLSTALLLCVLDISSAYCTPLSPQASQVLSSPNIKIAFVYILFLFSALVSSCLFLSRMIKHCNFTTYCSLKTQSHRVTANIRHTVVRFVITCGKVYFYCCQIMSPYQQCWHGS